MNLWKKRQEKNTPVAAYKFLCENRAYRLRVKSFSFRYAVIVTNVLYPVRILILNRVGSKFNYPGLGRRGRYTILKVIISARPGCLPTNYRGQKTRRQISLNNSGPLGFGQNRDISSTNRFLLFSDGFAGFPGDFRTVIIIIRSIDTFELFLSGSKRILICSVARKNTRTFDTRVVVKSGLSLSC